MSLINDALKRARTSPAPATPVSADATMIPVAAPVVSVPKTSRTPVGLIAGMVLCAGVAGWFFFKWREASTATKPTGQSTAMASVEKPKPAPQAAPATPNVTKPVAQEPAVAPVQTKPAVVVAAPVATPVVSAPAIAQAAPPKPASAPAPFVTANSPALLPELKLQAIVFRMKNPSALINGRHVEVGDDVSGVRIAEIQRTTVFIEWQGKKLPLRLN